MLETLSCIENIPIRIFVHNLLKIIIIVSDLVRKMLSSKVYCQTQRVKTHGEASEHSVLTTVQWNCDAPEDLEVGVFHAREFKNKT